MIVIEDQVEVERKVKSKVRPVVLNDCACAHTREQALAHRLARQAPCLFLGERAGNGN